MNTRKQLAQLPLLLGTLAMAATGFTQPADAELPSATFVDSAAPIFMQATGVLPAFLAPVASPTPLLGIATSVMPPGPNPGGRCSVDEFSGPACSAFGAQERCSAFNDNGNTCSVIAGTPTPDDRACSAFGNNAACSVLPPSFGAAPSFCSTINQSLFVAFCSAVGTANRQLCSTKGAGLSQCSASDALASPSQCSVLNFGAATSSFCSTKFNQPTIAKSCSAFANGSECSVAVGAKGVCTTFGAALPASCSAFIATAHCSVIGGPPGNPCAQ